jgi:hypothetical protein
MLPIRRRSDTRRLDPDDDGEQRRGGGTEKAPRGGTRPHALAIVGGLFRVGSPLTHLCRARSIPARVMWCARGSAILPHHEIRPLLETGGLFASDRRRSISKASQTHALVFRKLRVLERSSFQGRSSVGVPWNAPENGRVDGRTLAPAFQRTFESRVHASISRASRRNGRRTR